MQVRVLRDKGHKPNFAAAFDSVLIHTGAAVVRCPWKSELMLLESLLHLCIHPPSNISLATSQAS